jgi:predicted amidophosphoribosyltransferase
MPACPLCGATVPEGAVYCSNCGAAINSPATSISTAQPQVTSQGSPTWPNASSSGDMSARLEKAMRRAELLGYAAAGLGVAILFVLIVISLL